ncbi:unnamed protein product [Meloidogyne enterolobii]|uniref:Uncharacterized protein n=1 Tax=Meloidogyne enterolobii TaxID=390850 RepID=A0ACB0ZIV9_MELEN
MDAYNNEKAFQSQATFKMLRRLHGHNLESQGLNNLSEAFQSFVTRVKFFSVGRLRRTWSYSALEFMKYRRLLPMIVGDEQDPGSVFDEFMDIGVDGLPFTARQVEASLEEKGICVSNVSSKVQSCRIPSSKGSSVYATMPKKKLHGTCLITFKNPQSAVKAKRALPEELLFYGQQMVVMPYIASSASWRRTVSSPNAKMLDSEFNHESFSIGKLSRTSSGSSLASTTTCSSATLASTAPSASIPIDELPDRALTRILFFVGPLDRIRFERVSKHWLELSTKAWAQSRSLHFSEEPELLRHFNKSFPMCHAHLKAILRRCGPHIRSLSLADINQLFDENSVLEIGALCPELTNLNLSSITASPETLRVLSESFPKLTKIAYCGMTQTNEKAFLFLLKSMASRLRSVDFRGCTRLKGSFFTLFGTALEEVLLDGCILLDNHVIEDLSVRCNCIHTFKLDGCKKLNDESLSLISRNFNELTTLTLCGLFPLFTNNGLKQISRISSLQTLSLDYNPLVDDNLLSSISDNLQNLRKFTLSFAGTDCQITTNGLCLLAKFKKLEELDLSGLAALNVQVLKSICNDGCLELRTIFLRNCSYLGDDGIAELGNLTKLENVDLSGCILVSNESILKLCGLFKNESNPHANPVKIIIGGTICEPHKIRRPCGSRVILDQADNSSLNLNYLSSFVDENELFNGDEDDEFRILSAHRDFISNALQTEEDDSPLGDDPKKILAWVEREATELGLFNKE